MQCPKCGFELPTPRPDCARCGVVFARVRDRTGAPPPAPVPAASITAGPAAEDAESRRALLVGAAIAAVLMAVPLLRFLFSPLSTLVHEIGHSVASWLFGYPAIPSFDFVYGGGWSLRSERNAGVVLLLVAAFAGTCWLYRSNRRTLALLGAIAVPWLVLAVSRWHDLLIAFMGHGGELIFSGLFLYRGLSGRSCRVAVERPLYVAFGAFMLLRVLTFSWGLATNEDARAEYEEGKGGVLNDLHDIALDLHGRLGLPVGTAHVATFLMLCCALPPLCAWQWHRHRNAIRDWLARRLDREAG